MATPDIHSPADPASSPKSPENASSGTSTHSDAPFRFGSLGTEDILRVAGAVIVTCYVLGLLVVNSYLFQIGITDFSVLRTRFIAPLRSGALITASFAADQGREVFVLPGSIFAESAEGTNALLRDGARLVHNGTDILEDLGLGAGRNPIATQSQLLLDDNERRLYDALRAEARHIDELAEEAGLPAAAASAHLLTMELKGLVRNHGAQYYVLR